MYCLITTWHLIIARWRELKSKFQVSLLNGFSALASISRSDHTVRTIADPKLPGTVHLSRSWRQGGTFRLKSRCKAPSRDVRPQDEVSSYGGLRGPPPRSAHLLLSMCHSPPHSPLKPSVGLPLLRGMRVPDSSCSVGLPHRKDEEAPSRLSMATQYELFVPEIWGVSVIPAELSPS